MKTELIYALILFNSSALCSPNRSLTATGKYTDMSVDITPAKAVPKKQMANNIQ
jgi:hypothetical protein